MATSAPTSYSEIAHIALSVAQMIFYLWVYIEYYPKLEDFGDKLEELGQKEEQKYRRVRDWDDEFYAWYDKFFADEYKYCKSNVRRTKGSAFATFGTVTRIANRTNAGYTPLKMVRHVGDFAHNVVRTSATARAVAHTQEEKRVDDDLYNRWNSRITVPLERENEAPAFGPVIEGMASNLGAIGQGFNSAGTAFGTALYQYLRD